MNTYSKQKVIIGLSGGVDSAVTAYLLQKQGYDVSAVYLQCWKEPGCRADSDREDALKVALHLNLPYQVLNFTKEYKEQVLNYFLNEYKEGRTPNPDILCNSVIKFGIFYDWAKKQGADYIATGHYAKIISQGYTPSNSPLSRGRISQNTPFSLGGYRRGMSYFLSIPKDTHKDQTYFLYQIPHEKLEHVLFPLGDYLKSEVREIAREQNLPVAEKKDSMGICFVGDINVPEFLKEKFGVMKGEVQLCDGTVIGEHDGYYLFTVGKRGSWEWKVKNQKSKIKIKERFEMNNMPKLYVTEIRPRENVVVVGEREEAERQEFRIKNLKLREDIVSLLRSSEAYQEGIQAKYSREISLRNMDDLFVRIRNTGDLISAKLTQINDKTWQVELKKPEFGVSPGQSCVIYQQLTTHNSQLTTTIVVGGGVIVI